MKKYTAAKIAFVVSVLFVVPFYTHASGAGGSPTVTTSAPSTAATQSTPTVSSPTQSTTVQAASDASNPETYSNPAGSTVVGNGNITYVPLEPIPGLNQTGNVPFGILLNAIFKVLIIMGGIIATGSFVYAGVVYMTSDVLGSKSYARQRLTASLLGLLLLIGSWLILATINPQLLVFSDALNPIAPNYTYVPGSTQQSSTNQYLQDTSSCQSQDGQFNLYGNAASGYLNCDAAKAAGLLPTGTSCVSGSSYQSGGVCVLNGTSLGIVPGL